MIQLRNDMNRMVSEMTNLRESAKCNEFHENFVKLENEVCNEMIDYWFAFYCCQIGIVILLTIRSLFMCYNKQKLEHSNYSKHSNHKWMSTQLELGSKI